MLHSKTLMASCAVLALLAINNKVQAATIETKTVTTQQHQSGVDTVNFMAFDLNNDGVLSMSEVGEKLFAIFDRDNNGNIDNHEFDAKRVITIIPMEKETFRFVDYNNDGVAEETSHTYQTFMETSNLMRFDKDRDGLSAAEFIQVDYLKLDKNDDHLINMQEWKDAYIASRKYPNADQERYNN